MTERNSQNAAQGPSSPNNLLGSLDDVDKRIVDALVRDGRQPNNALAARVGIAPSTCLARTRSLVDRGIIRGFRADIDYSRAGADLQAVIFVRVAQPPDPD